MARIFRQTYSKPLPEGAQIIRRKGQRLARFKDSNGSTVTALLSQDQTKIIRETAKWYIEYRDARSLMAVLFSLLVLLSASSFLKYRELKKSVTLPALNNSLNDTGNQEFKRQHDRQWQ